MANLQVREKDACNDARKAKEKLVALIKRACTDVVKAKRLWKCLHQNLEGGSQKLESSQNHVSKESIACRSEPADSDAKTGIDFF